MALNHLYFKGVSNIGDSHITDRLETSLAFFLNWAFLEIGAFYNVEIPTSGAFGGDFSKLRAVRDPSYTNYKVYEAPRQDFIYETGVAYTGGSPIAITGVSVNGTIYGTGDATYGHYVDYPRGRVIFNSPLTSSSVVKLEYSYRQVQVYVAGDAPWWREAQFNSMRPDNSTFTQLGSGNWMIGSEKRVQMPAIIIESVPTRSFAGFEVGNGASLVFQTVNFDILSETKYDRDKLMDIISTQYFRNTIVFDTDSINFPLDYRGMLVSTDQYPDFVRPINDNLNRGQKALWRTVQVVDMGMVHPSLYTARVRVQMEIPYGSI